jgi:hypothetical protein
MLVADPVVQRESVDLAAVLFQPPLLLLPAIFVSVDRLIGTLGVCSPRTDSAAAIKDNEIVGSVVVDADHSGRHVLCRSGASLEARARANDPQPVCC